MKQDITAMFKAEFTHLLDQFEHVRSIALHAQQELRKYKTCTHVTETLNKEWRVLKEAVFSQKARLVADGEFLQDDVMNTSAADIRAANALLQEPFKFYGSYL